MFVAQKQLCDACFVLTRPSLQVQYPGAERVMMSDLRNLKALAWFLQKFELNFDILSSIKELSRQIKGEFDFRLGLSFQGIEPRVGVKRFWLD